MGFPLHDLLPQLPLHQQPPPVLYHVCSSRCCCTYPHPVWALGMPKHSRCGPQSVTTVAALLQPFDAGASGRSGKPAGKL